MEERIHKTYKSANKLMAESIGLLLLFYAVCIAAGSALNGRKDGWLHIEGVLIIGLMAYVPLVFWMALRAQKMLRPYLNIVLQECDSAQYAKAMSYAVAYGQRFHSGYKKSICQCFERYYVNAISVNGDLEGARYYIYQRLAVKPNSRAFRNLALLNDLDTAYAAKDAVAFDMAFQRLNPKLQQNKAIQAEKYQMEGNYQAMLDSLAGEPQDLYNKVIYAFLRAVAYDALQQPEQAKVQLGFVMANGNTLPCVAAAAEMLARMTR